MLSLQETFLTLSGLFHNFPTTTHTPCSCAQCTVQVQISSSSFLPQSSCLKLLQAPWPFVGTWASSGMGGQQPGLEKWLVGERWSPRTPTVPLARMCPPQAAGAGGQRDSNPSF